jgi:hypothetical protein
MVVEVLAGCATVCFCATLRFTQWVVAFQAKRDPTATRLANIRSVIEPLQRLFEAISSANTATVDDKSVKDKRLRELALEIERLSGIEAELLKVDEPRSKPKPGSSETKRQDLKYSIVKWHAKLQTPDVQARLKELEQQLLELDE